MNSAPYERRVRERLAAKSAGAPLLAIETSCDETAAAVVRGREVLSGVVYSQVALHQKYGGVVPELASRSHVERVGQVVSAALDEANVGIDDLGGIAVTQGPGLVGALLVGVSYAKALALAHALPLLAVNHIAGHICANYITHQTLEPPFICLVVSGGHSNIILVEGYTKFVPLGSTRDDAAGEAFDKVARAMGLPYPGGPNLEELARGGDADYMNFTSAFNDDPEHFDFSFSGIKTAVVNALSNAKQRGETPDVASIAASFQKAVVRTLVTKAVRAAKQSKTGKLALAGGVSANTALREAMRAEAQREGIAFYCPDLRYTTDNAAMIGCAGTFLLSENRLADLSLNAAPGLKLV